MRVLVLTLLLHSSKPAAATSAEARQQVPNTSGCRCRILPRLQACSPSWLTLMPRSEKCRRVNSYLMIVSTDSGTNKDSEEGHVTVCIEG
jgi:hypothetical protein